MAQGGLIVNTVGIEPKECPPNGADKKGRTFPAW